MIDHPCVGPKRTRRRKQPAYTSDWRAWLGVAIVVVSAAQVVYNAVGGVLPG